MAELGSAAIIPPEEPLTLLVWGPSRVLPVELTSLTITEEEFDTSLNPIRARVQLQLQVLSYLDLGPDSRGGALFMTHQVQKEALARANNVAGSLSTILSVLFPGGGTNGQGP
jgi:hypothetical protein